MNALVKKEIRLLLPNFVIACVLALAGCFFPNNPDSLLNSITYFIGCVVCPAAAIMLALSSFGAEVGSGIFTNLLALPVSRLKIWETKIALLIAAMLVVALLWVAGFLISAFHGSQNHGNNDWLDLLAVVIVFGLVIFSGGLWTVLLLRQVAAAFWFTLLIPGTLLMIVAALFGEYDGNFFEGLIVSVLGLYSLGGILFARWLFLRAQDVQWSGGNIVLPELRGLTRFKTAGVRREWRPRPALWRKEFMLHQSQLVMAFGLAVLHLAMLAAREYIDPAKSRDLMFVLENFWGLWFVMPLLIGCAAVAEERKLGTHEGQLCLPERRRTQFGIKLTVALGLSLLLGVVMPLLFEGTRILPGSPLSLASLQNDWSIPTSSAQALIWKCIVAMNLSLPILVFVLIAAMTCLVSFYVSTLARNTLQSLAPAVLGIMLATALLGMAGQSWNRTYDFLWSGPIPYIIGVPAMGLTLLFLAFRNFKEARTSLRMVWTNLAVLTGALLLSVVMTSAVYHRFWEKFTPFEPPHGTARLTPADTTQTRLDALWGETSVRLPDGTMWTARFASDLNNPVSLSQLLANYKVALADKQLLSGSNWVSLRRYGREIIGTKTDGTLWVSEAPMPVTKMGNGQWKVADQKMRNLVQYGSETNWRSATPVNFSALLVKNDGTFWRLGTNRVDEKHGPWPGLRTFTPYRLGTESDWLEAHMDYSPFKLEKTNGSLWISLDNYNYTNGLKWLEIEPGFSVVQIYDGAHGKFRSTAQISHGLQFKVGIREDGTFRIWAYLHLREKRRDYEWAATDLQIGSSTNWVAVADGREHVVTLKDDGTLWLWDFRNRYNRGWDEARSEQEVLKAVPTRLGSCADWVAISGSDESVVALSADGGLWYWPLSRPYYSDTYNSDRPKIEPWLDISHKPRLIGNVFADGH
jgi:hypothetical protein